jgi:mannitol-1-phosphate 5-dehydrogenase
MRAVIIGAGRVACGFLAPLLAESGYEVVLVGRRPEIVAAINQAEYSIDICHRDGSATVKRVRGVRAIAIWDLKRFHEAIAGARLIFTAAGAHGLPYVTTPLASAVISNLKALHPEGLDIISCENMSNAVALTREAVADLGSEEEWQTVEEAVRFRRAMVWRIVSDRCLTPEGLRFRADDVDRMDIEAPREWPPVAHIQGATPRPKMAEAIHEKLHIFNSGHAVAGYLGYAHGYEYIHEVFRECSLAETVAQALAEAASWPGELDSGESGPDPARAYLERYRNAAIRDRTVRVAARPIQKLGPFERLVLPAWATLTFGRTPVALIEGIVAALQFSHRQDAEATSIQRRVREVGYEKALEEVSGLRPTDELTQLVLARLNSQEVESPMLTPRAAAR